MRILLIFFTMLLGAGYLSAQDVNGCGDNDSKQQIKLDDNASFYRGGGHRGWGHGGYRHGGWGHHGWRGGYRGWGYGGYRGWGYGGYGGYGYYPYYYGYGYYPYYYGYNNYYEPPAEKLPPIVEEVRVPVVKKIPVLQEVIKVVRPEITTVKVPTTIRKTVVGSPIEGPVGGPAPVGGAPVQGPPQGGDNGQGGGGQMPNFGGGQGFGGQQDFGGQQGGGQMPQGGNQ